MKIDGAITAPEILGALRSVELRGRHETARRLRATIGEVFRYAVATGRAGTDPTGALKGALTAPTVRHRAAIIEPKAFGGVLRAIETYEGARARPGPGVLTSAMINLLRIVAIELGTWRSVLGGGASGSVTFGNGKPLRPILELWERGDSAYPMIVTS